MPQLSDILAGSQIHATNDVPRCEVTGDELPQGSRKAGMDCLCRICQAYVAGWRASFQVVREALVALELDDLEFVHSCRSRPAAQQDESEPL